MDFVNIIGLNSSVELVGEPNYAIIPYESSWRKSIVVPMTA